MMPASGRTVNAIVRHNPRNVGSRRPGSLRQPSSTRLALAYLAGGLAEVGFGGAAEGGGAGEADLGGERGDPDRLVLQQRLNALHAPAVEQHVRALARCLCRPQSVCLVLLPVGPRGHARLALKRAAQHHAAAVASPPVAHPDAGRDGLPRTDHNYGQSVARGTTQTPSLRR